MDTQFIDLNRQRPWERPMDIEPGGDAVATRAPFNPADYLTDLRGKQYLEVRYRLMWLEATCPYFNIYTREVKITPEIAIFSATVSIYPDATANANDGDPEWNRPATRTATAHGSETPVDFGDYIEKAETKAIGRALAMLGFGTQFAAEFNSEITDAPRERPVDTPVQRGQTIRTPLGPNNPMRESNWMTGQQGRRQPAAGQGQMQNPDGPPTDKQKNFARGLAEKIYGVAWEDEVERILAEQFSPDQNTFGTMTKGEASKLIEYLKGMADA